MPLHFKGLNRDTLLTISEVHSEEKKYKILLGQQMPLRRIEQTRIKPINFD